MSSLIVHPLAGGSIVVVEPHADDAFLSMGGHIETWVKEGFKVLIITVFSGTRKRGADAKAYAEAVGASWSGLGAKEPDDGGKAGEGRQAIVRGLLPAMRDFKAEREAPLIIPLGIKHPEHIEVRATVQEYKHVIRHEVFHYTDQPYSATQSNTEELNEKLRGTEVQSILRPHARKYRHWKLFKDQAKFFHFNPPEKLVYNIEMVVRYAVL